jgi:hypothetical protein
MKIKFSKSDRKLITALVDRLLDVVADVIDQPARIAQMEAHKEVEVARLKSQTILKMASAGLSATGRRPTRGPSGPGQFILIDDLDELCPIVDQIERSEFDASPAFRAWSRIQRAARQQHQVHVRGPNEDTEYNAAAQNGES